MSIEIKGLEALLDELDNIASPEATTKALQKACALVEGAARRKAPKGDGALRRSITSKVENNEGIIFTPLEYAPYVEYGTGLFAENGGRQDVPWSYQDDKGEWHSTSGMKPQPYMRPALYENQQAILNIIKEGITDND